MSAWAVRKVDRKAALWLQRKMPLLLKRGKIQHLKDTPIIPSAFTTWFSFASSPQDFDYWANIAVACGFWVPRYTCASCGKDVYAVDEDFSLCYMCDIKYTKGNVSFAARRRIDA